MAHHDTAHSAPRARRPSRVVLAVVAVLVVALGGVVWATGGFAPAGHPPPEDPGATISNDLFSVEVPDEATLITHESSFGDPRFELAVRTTLTSHETGPEAASVILDLIEAELLPMGGQTRASHITVARDPSTHVPYPWVQPATEPVTLYWKVDLDADPHEVKRVDEVRLRVMDAVHEEGFLDQAERWRNTNGRGVGNAVLPVTHVTEE